MTMTLAQASSVAQVAQKAREDMAQLTGQPVVSVVSCAQEADGWRVVLETLERKAIPDSSDLLAAFAVILDRDGALINFQRVRVRRRGDPIIEE